MTVFIYIFQWIQFSSKVNIITCVTELSTIDCNWEAFFKALFWAAHESMLHNFCTVQFNLNLNPILSEILIKKLHFCFIAVMKSLAHFQLSTKVSFSFCRLCSMQRPIESGPTFCMPSKLPSLLFPYRSLTTRRTKTKRSPTTQKYIKEIYSLIFSTLR